MAARPRHRRRFTRPEGGSPPPEARRSNAAIPLVIAVLLVGLYLGTYSILVPAFLGLLLAYTGGSFLSSRMNPFSIGFYLSTKPSWLAIGVIFLCALVLFGAAYALYATHLGRLLP